MSQISHPADAPQIRTSRSFSTELAPALRISRCGRSWLSKPAWTRSSSERPNREVRTKPGDNAPHDPQFLVAANQADTLWQSLHGRRFTSGSAPFGPRLFNRGFLADVVGLCLSRYPAQIT